MNPIKEKHPARRSESSTRAVLSSVLISIPILALVGCATLPQRRVLISDHVHSQTGITLTSWPADLRAFPMLAKVDPDQVAELSKLASEIKDTASPARKIRLTENFNRQFNLHVHYVLLPEAPARTVVSLEKLDGEIKVDPKELADGKAELVAEQAVLDRGAMPYSELKAYLAYLAFIQTANNDSKTDSVFNQFLLDILQIAEPSR